VHGGGVKHWYQFSDLAGWEESNGVGGALLADKGKPCGHVELPVEEHSLVILIDDDSDFFSFSVLGWDIDVFLSPVDMHLKLDLVIELRFQNEVIESTTNKGIWSNVGVRHVVLRSDLLLLLLH
jgi:hypothetical protein